MPHSITCGACKASFSIPDDVWEKRVQGQIATLKCRQCKSPIQVDGRSRKGAATATPASTAGIADQFSPTQVAAPVDAPKKIADAITQIKDDKVVEAKPDEKREHQANKLEAKPAQPQTVGSDLGLARPALERPRTGQQPMRTELKPAEPKGAAQKSSFDAQSKPGAENGPTATVGRAAPFVGASAAAHAPSALQAHKGAERTAAPHAPTAASLSKPTFDATAKLKAAVATRAEVKSSPSITKGDDDVDGLWSIRPQAPAPAPAEVKSSPNVAKSDDDLEELWVVSFSVDDDRELTTAQVREFIDKGQLNGDTIVWKEGMSDWLPIAEVPELAPSLKPKPGARAAAADDSEDETIIYRPGSKAANFIDSSTSSFAAARSAAIAAVSSTENALGLAASRQQQPVATRTTSLGARQDAPNAAAAARAQARTPPTTAQHATDVQSPKHEFAPRATVDTPVARGTPTASKAAAMPPPLRRAQPSRPDDSAQHNSPGIPAAQRPGRDEIVTSVREYTPAHAAAPPPLPPAEKREAPQDVPVAKPAIFPPAVQPAEPVQAASPFSPVAAPHSLPPTPSFAPRPSDIAALTKIRPKFPKWLPFAVLGGLVLLVAIMAAMSWLRGDTIESKEQKSADNSGPIGPLPPEPGRSTGAAQTSLETLQKTTPAPASDGFANSFAQAVAKQRPTGKFDRDAAEKALAPAFAKAAGCHNKGEPTGTANLTISISPSGQVLSVTVAQPFATTFTAECIRNALRDASVPPFQGSPGRLAHSITIH